MLLAQITFDCSMSFAFGFCSISFSSLAHIDCIVTKVTALSFTLAIPNTSIKRHNRQISIEQCNSHFLSILLFFSFSSRNVTKIVYTFYATRDNLDKMFNTRSSNSNSASEFQFRLSYIVDGERCVGRACLRRRNGRKKCSRCLWQKKEMQQNNIIDVSLPIACSERETFKIEALLVNHSDHFVCVRSHREENSF